MVSREAYSTCQIDAKKSITTQSNVYFSASITIIYHQSAKDFKVLNEDDWLKCCHLSYYKMPWFNYGEIICLIWHYQCKSQ